MQVWVSCSSIRLVAAPSGRSADEEVLEAMLSENAEKRKLDVADEAEEYNKKVKV